MAGTASIAWIGNPADTEITMLFSDLYNWSESPAGTYCASGGDVGEAESSQSLPASTDGYIVIDVPDSNSHQVVLGFALVDSLTPPDMFFNFDYGIYVEGTFKTKDSGGFEDSGISAVDGDRIRLIRSGSTVTAQYYRSGSWTNIEVFGTTTSAELFIYVSSGAGNKCMVNPKGFGIS